MKTIERLLAASQTVWDGYHTHPFVEGLKNGTLDVEKFRFYIMQDYWYLVEYARVFAVGIARGHRLDVMQLFTSYLQAILGGEMNIHNGYMPRLKITQEELDAMPMAQDNRSYTAYMLAVAHAGGEAEVLTAILSCAYSYEVIGRRIAEERPEAMEHPLYGDWVKGYAGERYHQDNIRLLNMLEQLTAGYSEQQLHVLEEIFVACSRYEAAFWDMAWEQRL